jgi:protease-4
MKRLLLAYFCLVALAVTGAAVFVLRGGIKKPAHSTILSWHLTGSLPDRAPSTLPFFDKEEASWGDVYTALHALRGDDDIRGLAITIDEPRFGLAKAQEIRDELLAVRKSGRFVECYLPTAGEGSNGTLPYFLATACDHIHLAPLGQVNLVGLNAEGIYLHDTLDKLKVDAQFVKMGQFKSAPEMFTETHPSDSATLELNAMLDTFYGQIVEGIARARHLAPDSVRSIIDEAPYDADDALRLHLVDAVDYPDDFRTQVTARAPSARLRSLDSYDGASDLGAGVAVVAVTGGLVREGPSNLEEETSSDSLVRELNRLADDDSARAVVLRIDSPGGSVLASDLMLHAIERVHRHKPVVVSMSDAAASGGYYIAALADRIVAEPATLTGSIGVFTGKFVTRRLEEEILGVHRVANRRGAEAGIYSTLAPFSPAEQAKVLSSIQGVYRTFVGNVAKGRHLSREAVEAIASGRVWSGLDAHRVGLVDEIGGLDKAVNAARKAAHLDADTPVRFYPQPVSWLERIRHHSPEPLSVQMSRLAAQLAPKPRHMLELGPEWKSLLQPF